MALSFKDFSLVATDASTRHSIIVTEQHHAKCYSLTDTALMAVVGQAGDASNFAEFVQKNVALYRMRNSYDMDVEQIFHFTRRQISESLRRVSLNSRVSHNGMVVAFSKSFKRHP